MPSKTKDQDANTIESPKQKTTEYVESSRSRASTDQSVESEDKESKRLRRSSSSKSGSPTPDEGAPPLPDEALPSSPSTRNTAATGTDDGWIPVWDEPAQAYYFYNKFTHETTWTNPRVPEATASAPGIANHDREAPAHGGYNPAIHGDYDPTAPYAQATTTNEDVNLSVKVDEGAIYTATGQFNRFTGKWQSSELRPENYNDDAKSKRQMNAFFDVDAAANSHDGKSLKAERSGKKLSKKELKQFKEKRRERKEEKRRAWLRD